MKTLLFLTDRFPFGKGEAFIENEIPYLTKAFDKVIVIPTGLTVNAEYMREMPENFIVLPPANTDDLYKNGRPSKKQRISWSVKHMLPWILDSFFTAEFWKELRIMMHEGKLKPRNVAAVVRTLAPLVRNNKHFKKCFCKMHIELTDDIYLYSYWANYSICMMIKCCRNLSNLEI